MVLKIIEMFFKLMILVHLVIDQGVVGYTILSGRVRRDGDEGVRNQILSKINEQKYLTVPLSLDTDYPLNVSSYLYVTNFDSVSEVNMDFSVGILLQLHWIDVRDRVTSTLTDWKNDYIEFDSIFIKDLWVPDIYFPNEKKASFHNVINPNKVLRLYKNHSVIFETRLSMTLSCPMDLRSYPFDKQTCAIKIECFGYTEDKITLRWTNTSRPVRLKEGMELPQFKLVGSHYVTSRRESIITGNYSTLEAEFILARNINYYVIQMYIPSLMIVMLSWVSFWLNVNSVPGRVSLGVLSVLTISTQSSSVNASLPRVSYTKAIDVWMATCLVFVVAALIEFAVANVISRKGSGKGLLIKRMFRIPKESNKEPVLEKPNVKQNFDTEYGVRCREKGEKDTMVNAHGAIKLSQNSFQTVPEDDDVKKPSVNNGVVYALYLDFASRLMFPLMFVVFNIVYWLYYLNVIDY